MFRLPVGHRPQVERRLPDPAGQGRAVQVETGARLDLDLAIDGRVLGVLETSTWATAPSVGRPPSIRRAIVSEETFALAEERLQRNKVFSRRRTKTTSVSQGLVASGKCGYALYRTSARNSARKSSCYRCLGSDAWRHLSGLLCDSRPVLQDLLDEIVWIELVRLLEEPLRPLESVRSVLPSAADKTSALRLI